MKKLYALLTLGCFIAGLAFYALYNQWILISFALFNNRQITARTVLNKKLITVWFLNNGTIATEKKEILTDQKPATIAKNITTTWLSLMSEADTTKKKCSLLHAAMVNGGTELILSFDRSILTKQASIETRWQTVESLFKTLRENGVQAKTVRLLVNQKPLHDELLDFSRPLPLESFYNQTTIPQEKPRIKNTPHIMLCIPEMFNGRTIDDAFERSIIVNALRFLAQKLEQDHGVYCTLNIPSRDAQNELTYAQATSANRLNVDVVLYLFFSHNKQGTNTVQIYYPLYHPTTDFWRSQEHELSFIPHHQGYRQSLSKSSYYASTLAHLIQQECALKPRVQGLPLSCLASIQRPAIAIECGISSEKEWSTSLHLISTALAKLLQGCQT